VLFCDLVGFTPAPTTPAPRTSPTCCAYHAQLRHQVQHFGGTLDKFVCDGAMVVFGAPLAHEDDPVRAVRYALGPWLPSTSSIRRTMGWSWRCAGVTSGEAPHGLGVPLVFVPVADPKVGKNRSTWTYQASPPTSRPRWSPASPVVVPSPSTSARARMSHGWCR
jgi:hypothetical protein